MYQHKRSVSALSLLVVILFFFAKTSTPQLDYSKVDSPQNVTIPSLSYATISTRTNRYGYFRAFFYAYSYVYFRIIQSNPSSNQIPEQIPNSFTDQGFNWLQIGHVNKTFKFNPIGKTYRDYSFVLYNVAMNPATVQVNQLIYKEEYGELSSQIDQYAFLQSGDSEKIKCLAGVCVEKRSRSVGIVVYPNYLSDSQYSSVSQNKFPITLDIYATNNYEGYNSYGYLELSDNTRRNRLKTIVINDANDYKRVYFVMDNASDPIYIWISCSDKTYYGVCSIRYRVTPGSDETANTVGGIIGLVLGVLLLITLIISVIGVVCCVKKRKKKAALNKENTQGNIQVVVSNGDQNTSSSTLLQDYEKGNGSYASLQSQTIDTYRDPASTDFPTMRSTIPMSSSIISNSSKIDNGGNYLLNKRYEVVQKIGNGAFGVCYMCNDTKRNQKVAIKCIGMESSEQDKIFSELSKTATIQHERLVQVFELFVSQEMSAFCLVMKYYNGDLEKFLKEYNRPFSDKTIVSLMNQLGEGLDYLHSVKMFVHRDLKPKNIFVDVFDPEQENVQVVIGDLGEAKELFGTDSHSMRGTLAYIAPETLSGEACGYAVDIFALGITFYQIIMMDAVDARISTQLLGQNEEQVLSKVRSNMLSKTTNEKLVEFVIRMLRKDPNNRPTAADLKKFSLN